MLIAGRIFFVSTRGRRHDFPPADAKLLQRALQEMRDHKQETEKWSQQRLADEIGVTQAAVSQVLSTSGNNMSAAMANGLAEFAGFDSAQHMLENLRRGRSILLGPDPHERACDEMPIGTFLLRIGRLPGLLRWVEENPHAVTVADLARGVSAYETLKPRSREDGQPFGGWGAYLSDVINGRTEDAKVDDEAAELLERGQMAKTSRRLLKS